MSMRAKALAYYITEAGRHPDGWSGDAAQEISDCLNAMEKELFELRERIRELEKGSAGNE